MRSNERGEDCELNGVTIDIDPVIVHIGHMAIRWYGLLVAVAILTGARFAVREIRRRGLPAAVHDSDDMLSRKQFAISSLVRLSGISLVALTLTVTVWPSGAIVLAGLSAFHLLALVLTALPLPKELRQA